MKTQSFDPAVYYACKVPGASKLPNAAGSKYYAEKVVDMLLSAAICLATAVVLLVLVTM